MMKQKVCGNCSSPLADQSIFCGQCGSITAYGTSLLAKRAKIKSVLKQLNKEYRSGKITERTYKTRRARYLKKLEEINSVLPDKGAVIIKPQPRDKTKTKEPPEKVQEKVIYANPPPLPWPSILSYLAAAALIVVFSLTLIWGFVGEGFETVWLDQFYLLMFALVGPVLYILWMYRTDKFESEPLYFVVIIFGWGAFAAFLSFIGNTLFDVAGLWLPWLSAPIVEESFKAVGVYLMAKHPEFNSPMDGMVYGFAAGMGFAWMENFFYIILAYEGDLFMSLLRVFIFSLGHGVYTAFIGWALGVAKVRKGYVQKRDLIPGLALAMFAHGWYNSDLIPVVDLSSLALWLILSDGIFIALLYALIRRAWREERLWGYDRGLAPK